MVRTLRSLDVDPAPIFSEGGLALDKLEDSELRVPVEQSRRILGLACDASGEPAFGLRMVEQIEGGAHTLFTYLSASSATPREAYSRAIRYVRIVHDALRISLRLEGERAICETAMPGFARSRAEAELAVGLMVALSPKVMGEEVLREAWFVHEAPDYADQYARVFPCTVRFGADCDAIVGDAAGIDRPLPRADSELCSLIEAHAQQQLAKLPPIGDFSDTVRQRIQSALQGDDPSAEAISSGLGISSRTLRRRLKECGTTHQQLLDAVRREIALPALGQRGVSMNEVAYLTGFSDASAFHKAFRRWTGQSPGEYQSEVRASAR